VSPAIPFKENKVRGRGIKIIQDIHSETDKIFLYDPKMHHSIITASLL